MRPTMTAAIGLRHSLNPSRTAFRARTQQRFSSTSTEEAQKKAQETLANVTKNAAQFWETAKVKVLDPAGERIGNLLGSYKQPILYNLAVAREIVKKVYIAEGLQPPTWEAAKAAYTSMYADATSRAFWKNVISSGEYGRIGVYGVQAYGIFKIGEMIGRRSIIGYNLK